MSFGGFGAKPSGFGQSQPTFGQTAQPSAFGGGAATGAFGAQAKPGGFGAAAGGSIFGQASAPSAFGASAAGGSVFGASGAGGLGQSQSAFGGASTFGASTGSAFGGPSAFGGAAAAGGSAFGAKPAFGATGGSAFGQPAASGLGGGFGASTGGAFGASAGGSTFGGTSAFGGGAATGSVFGGGAQTSAFGGAAGAGGSMPPYQPTHDQEGTLRTITHSITAMPAYRTQSFEELRFLDYQQGRKNAQAQPGGAAAGGGVFGQTPAAGGSIFGGGAAASTGAFGQSQSAFGGASAAGGSLFGAAASTGAAFGGAGAFGAQAKPGGFGAPAAAGSAFGAPATTSAFGAAQSSGSLFGGGGSAFGASTGSSFAFGGAAAAKPAFGAASAPATSGGLFGAPAASAGGSLFGAAPAASSGGLFGAKPAGTTGGMFSMGGAAGAASTGGSLFGAKPAGATGGLFGAPAASTGGSLFGAAPAASSGGLFGASTAAAGTTSLFGAKPAAGGGLFGAAASAPAAGGGLFGAAKPATGGGLFGASASAFGTAQTASAFGAAPAFGAPATTTTSAFGAGAFGATAQPTQPLTASLGAQPYGNNSLFANTNPVAAGTASAPAAPAVAPTQTAVGLRHRDAARKAAAVASPSYKTAPKSAVHIKPRGFSALPGGKLSLLDGDAALPVLSPDVFVARHSVKHLTIESPIVPVSQASSGNNADTTNGDSSFVDHANDRRRVTFGGAANASTASSAGGAFSSPAPQTPTRGNNTSGTGSANGDTSQIVVPQFVRPETGVYVPPDSVDPHADAQRYETYEDFYNDQLRHEQQDNSRGSVNGSEDLGRRRSAEQRGGGRGPPRLSKEGYYTIPSINELNSMSEGDRSHIVNFVIGRSGIGQVEFLGQTDVNDLALDDIVIFRPKEVIVYPEELHKPEVGDELNKPSEVTLHDCLPIDKKTMQPTRDPEVIQKLVSRVRRKTVKMGAEFISFDTENGDWTFRVEHFSRYGLDDDSDSEDENEPPVQQRGARGSRKAPPGKRLQLSITGDADDAEVMVDPDASTDIMDENADDIAPLGDVSHTRSENRFRATLDSDSSDDRGSFAPEESPIRAPRAMDQDLSTASGMPDDDRAGTGFGRMSSGPSLPQQLGLNPASMRQMKSSLFGSGDGDGLNANNAPSGGIGGVTPSSSFPDRPSMPLTSSQFSGNRPKSSILALDAQPLPSQGSTTPGGGLRPSLRRPVEAAMSNAPATPGVSEYEAARRSQAPGSQHRTLNATAASLFPLAAGPSSTSARDASRLTNLTTAITPARGVPSTASGKGIAEPVMQMVSHAANALPVILPEDSVGHGKTQLRTDAGLYMGRSFRPSWGWPNVLVSPAAGNARGVNSQVSITPLSGTRFQSTPSMSDEDAEPIEAAKTSYTTPLSVHLKNCETAGSDPVGCPAVIGLPTDQRLYEVLAQYLDASESEPDTQQVWSLIEALWGNALDPFYSMGGDGMDEDSRPAALASSMFEGALDGLSPELYAQRVARRAGLSRWLQSAVGDDVKEAARSSSVNSLQRIFAFLTGRNIQDAVNLAIAGKDHRLALLLAQAGSAGALREDLASQRSIWEETGAVAFIDKDRERIFALLSGDMSVVSSLDWRRAFAAYLWYGCEPHASITDVLSVYDGASQHANAPFPHPRYHADGERAPGSRSQSAVDLAYHLIHLYTSRSYSLTKALLPASLSAHPMEYAQSWHVYSVLKALSFPDLPRPAVIHTSFAMQLELVGLWEWAVYVLLHLPGDSSLDQALRSQAVRSLIEKHSMQLDDPATLPPEDDVMTIADFLADTLNIPQTWIAAARVVSARYNGDKVAEFGYLVEAGQYNEAHELLIAHLGPQGILRRDDSLPEWLSMLSAHADVITHWAEGGAVYEDYLAIGPSRRSVPDGASGVPTLVAIQRSVVSIAQRMARWAAKTAPARIAFADMATQTSVHLRQVGEEISARRNEVPSGVTGSGVAVALPHMHALPLPASYRARELDAMASAFVADLFRAPDQVAS